MGDRVRLRFPTVESFLIRSQGALADSGRALTAEERRLLMTIFGSSVNLNPVRIAITDLGVDGRAYTLGNTIRVPRGASLDARTLVHEMTHVWQFQTRGSGYISDSLTQQVAHGRAAYSVTIIPGQSIYDYTAEQQAVIVEQYYADDPAGWRTNPDVVRMLEQVRRAQQLSAEEIQRETFFGPGRNLLDDPAAGSRDRTPQTVPLIRIEF